MRVEKPISKIPYILAAIDEKQFGCTIVIEQSFPCRTIKEGREREKEGERGPRYFEGQIGNYGPEKIFRWLNTVTPLQ